MALTSRTNGWEEHIPSCEENYLRQSDQDKPVVLVVMAIGLSCCSTVLDMVLHFGAIKPKKKQLIEEAQRRYKLRFNNFHPYMPRNFWNKDQAMTWLLNNPIQGSADVQFIRTRLASTGYGVDRNPPAHEPAQPSICGPWNNLNMNRASHNEAETKAPRAYSNESPVANAVQSLETAAMEENARTAQSITWVFEQAAAVIAEKEARAAKSDEHILMAKALGLAGCHFGDKPFDRYKRRCSPSREVLYDECRRRFRILNIQLKRDGTRKLYPDIRSTKETMINWLKRNPIPSAEERQQITARVQALKEELVAERRRVQVSSGKGHKSRLSLSVFMTER